MEQQRTYRYRCYPTADQAASLARTFGCARFVYNWALRLRTEAYYHRQERVGYAATSAALTALKREPATAWLNDVSSVPSQQALRHLDRAFRQFFEGRAPYPAFRQKHGQQAAEFTTSAFRWDAARRTLTLAKMAAPLAIRWSRAFTGPPRTVTVTRDPAGRYFVSFLVEEEVAPLPPTDAAVGLAVGGAALVTLSTGEHVTTPKPDVRSLHRIRKAQKRLARQQHGSKNREKQRRKVARAHARLVDQRRDGLHQLTTRLIRENQTVCVETPATRPVVGTPRLAQAISAGRWNELVRQLTYKAAWYGRTLVTIDKGYPSTKRCSGCGHVLGSLPLTARHWTCPACGARHDREVNAATNVLAAGRAVNACGEAIRPGRAAPATARPDEAGIPRL
jgi:putative transposase